MLLKSEEEEEDKEKENKLVIDKERIPKNLQSQVISLGSTFSFHLLILFKEIHYSY